MARIQLQLIADNKTPQYFFFVHLVIWSFQPIKFYALQSVNLFHTLCGDLLLLVDNITYSNVRLIKYIQ